MTRHGACMRGGFLVHGLKAFVRCAQFFTQRCLREPNSLPHMRIVNAGEAIPDIVLKHPRIFEYKVTPEGVLAKGKARIQVSGAASSVARRALGWTVWHKTPKAVHGS